MASAPPKTSSSLPDWAANLALVIASAVVGLILIELALRLLGWSHPVFVRPDPELGWSFRPGIEGWSTHEDTAYVRINRAGFRGADTPTEPAPGTLRIAILGDSFTDSTNLSEANSLSGMIQSHLAACPALAGRPVEVLNFGVSGYSTAQQYLGLQKQVGQYHPGIVLLAFYAGNDVVENSRPLSVTTNVMKPFFVLGPSGELEFDGSFRDSDAFGAVVAADWQRRLVNASYLLQNLKQAFLGKPIAPSPLTSQVFKPRDGDPLPPPQYHGLFGPPADADWRAAWSVTEKLLVRMRDWVRGHGMDFRMTVIPTPNQALPGEARRRAEMEKYHLVDLDYPVTGVVDIAARHGIAYLSLLEPLRSFGDRMQRYTYGFYADRPGDGHLNAVGNEVSGRAIADWLCASGAVGASS